jgi:predicted dehydrogenase
VNVLLVGLGRWGEKHLRVLAQLGATVWVADVDPARRAWALAQGVDGRRAVADFHDALPHVEAVDVVTPAGSHRAVAAAGLTAGRHCFVEKPLAASVADGRAIAACAREAGRVVHVGHVFRFHPVTATLRAALGGGAIGKTRYATARFSGFKRPRTDVGVTHSDAIHFFDLFAHLLGREATAVTSLQRDFLGRGLDDMALTTVFYGEVPVSVEASYFEPVTRRECVVVGEAGALVADFRQGRVVLHAGQHVQRGGAWRAVEAGTHTLPVGGEEPLRLELAAFLAACRGEASEGTTIEAGVHALEIVEAAACSARLGRTVLLGEVR